ncbi:hypothetical protein ACEN88_33120, partial [Massilia sp. CT11-108]
MHTHPNESEFDVIVVGGSYAGHLRQGARDLSLLVRALTTGGTSTINFATAAPPPAAMFARHGIDLAPALA